MVSLQIKDVLKFFDEKPQDSVYHATAMYSVAGEEMGIALLHHYLESQGNKVNRVKGLPTTGKQKGHRLDYWLLSATSQSRILYQVEVKNWSSHAIGGKCLSIDANKRETSEYKKEQWRQQWQNGSFIQPSAAKVLTPMHPPKTTYDSIEPMVCFWTALHPEGLEQPLFVVKPHNAEFQSVYVFSMSSYLRNLLASGERVALLEMPNTVARMNWLKTFFGYSN